MVDATPDFREQYSALLSACKHSSPKLKGILLTHAHMGHYTGLMHLGRESMNASLLEVRCSAPMADFLRSNEPWGSLCSRRNIFLQTFRPDETRRLSDTLTFVPIPVPHRDEHADTFAFLFRGSSGSLLYCPDIDSWEDTNVLDTEADARLVDGCFYSADELNGRDQSEVPHPLITDTLARATKPVNFIHLNHTNPVWDAGPERSVVEATGHRVGAAGDRWEL